jgi:hypothetical protein
MSDALISNMRDRVDRCRRLAKMIHDPRAIAILEQMAEEGEADIAKLQAENAAANGSANSDPAG